MVSTRRRRHLFPVIAVTLVMLAPLALMLREETGTSLPQTPYSALAVMALRSAALPAVAVTISLIVAAAAVAAGYLVLPRWTRRAPPHRRRWAPRT